MYKKVVALTLAVWALLCLCPPAAKAQEHIGFTYSAEASLHANYLWRGMYIGGACLQAEASVGYGGLYTTMWWNLGLEDYHSCTFLPEIDLSIGFQRWGLDIKAMLIHTFDGPISDWSYHDSINSNSLELRATYTLSERIPLTLLWGTRVVPGDSYRQADGTLRQAYSTYVEVSYVVQMEHDIALRAAVGMTPWRSLYTGYRGRFAVCCIDLMCYRCWDLSTHCGLSVGGELMVNPHAKTMQGNLTCSVYVK